MELRRPYTLLFLILLFCSSRVAGQAVEEAGKGGKEPVLSAQAKEELETLDHLISKVHWRTDPDSAFYFAELLFERASRLGANKWKSRTLKHQVSLLYRTGKYEQALVILEDAVLQQIQFQDWKALAGLYRQQGSNLRKLGRIPESLDAYQNGLSTAAKLKDEGRASSAAILNSMGSLFLNQQDFEKAKEYYEASLELHTEINKESGIAANINNLSKVYTALGEYDVAQDFLLRSLAIKRAKNDLEGIANSNKNLGDIFLKQGELDSARHHYTIALHWQDSLSLRGDEASSFADLGVVSLKEENWRNAANWCSRGWEQSWLIGDLKVQVKNGDCLYQALRELGKPQDALMILEETRQLQDSFLSAANTRELNEIERTYQQQRQELTAEINLQADAENGATSWWWLLLILPLGALLIYRFKRIARYAKTPELSPEANVSFSEQIPATESLEGTPSTATETLREVDAAWLLELEKVLKKEIANPEFSVDQMARALFISRSKLQRRVKKITKLTPIGYFRELKLQAAMDLLTSGKVETIKQVANEVGFETPQYFSKLFEQHYGKKPGEWL